MVRFVGTGSAHVVTASLNGWDDSIRYVSLYDNVYLRYFKGHRSKVTSIASSPTQNIFISSSLDDSIRLWDLRTSSSQAFILENDPRVSFDPLGIVMASATENAKINLYDTRKFDSEPFLSWKLTKFETIDPPRWASICFSNNGQYLLISTYSTQIYLLDTFDGSCIQKYNRSNSKGIAIDCSFSKDDQYVISGSDNGNIYVWFTLNGKVATILAFDDRPIRCLLWHHTINMIIAGGDQFSIWV